MPSIFLILLLLFLFLYFNYVRIFLKILLCENLFSLAENIFLICCNKEVRNADVRYTNIVNNLLSNLCRSLTYSSNIQKKVYRLLVHVPFRLFFFLFNCILFNLIFFMMNGVKKMFGMCFRSRWMV